MNDQHQPGGPNREHKPGGAQREHRPGGQTREHRPGGQSREQRPGGQTREQRPGGQNRAHQDGERRPAFRQGGGQGRPSGRPDFRRRGPAPARPARPAAPKTDIGLPARRVALQVIRLVTENGAYASMALDEQLRKSSLSAVDRRLAARLAYDTLENLMYLDHALRQVMAREDTDTRLLNVMRLGACQLLLEDRIPESAATNTSVQLCKELGMEPLAGVCNGILRSLIRDRETLKWPDPETEPIRALSVRWSLPEWLVRALIADWGREAATALMAVRGGGAPVMIRRNLLRCPEAEMNRLLEAKVWEAEPGPLPGSYALRGTLNIGEDRDFQGGLFSIQSMGSMLACLAMDPQRGWTVLDACAAPGGKSCYMAELMGGTGRVQAWELHPHRVELIEAQVKRLRLENVRAMVRDATVTRENLRMTMDAALVDAPCTGTGDLAEKPDIRLRLREDNLAQLIRTQAAILDAVSDTVREGGVLLYSTCSVLRDENDRQVAAFLARHPDFERETLPASVPERFRARESEQGLQLLPQTDGIGFFISRMRRKRM